MIEPQTMARVDRNERRRKRLIALLAEAQSDKLVAELAEIPASYLSQIKTGERDSFGQDVAARIEAAMKRPDGWLDQWLTEEGGYAAANRPPDWYLLELLGDLPEDFRSSIRQQIITAARALKKASVAKKKASKT
jgi:hypothetical protein